MAKPKVQFTDEVKEIKPTASTSTVLETTVLIYHDVRLKEDDGKIITSIFEAKSILAQIS